MTKTILPPPPPPKLTPPATKEQIQEQKQPQEPETPVLIEYKVVAVQKKQTKTQKDMLTGTLLYNDPATQSVKSQSFFVWQADISSMLPRLKQGSIINVLKQDTFNDAIVLQSIKVVKEGRSGLTEKEASILYAKIKRTADKYAASSYDAKTVSIFKAILALYQEKEQLLLRSAAALKHHHNYIGGLLVHIDEMLSFVQVNTESIKGINKPLTEAGVLLHDLWKTEEYKISTDDLVEIDQEWQDKNISHIHKAWSWCNQNGFDELAHMVASHHGLKDWGALQEPQTPEAQLLFLADMYSSKLGKINVDMLED